MNRAWL
jgi:transcription factor IIIB subunit 2